MMQDERYKIMLIDDDESVHELMRSILEGAGYVFCEAYDGSSGIAALIEQRPDLLLLDVMMHGMNGFDVCRDIRAHGRRIPIIFLSAKGDIVDKSIGFKAGGDDYVVKPFETDELLLRIEAHLRRARGNLAPKPEQDASPESCHVGDVEVFFNRYEVRVKGKPIKLSAQEFKIVALLASHPGEVFTRAQIYEHIWGETGGVDESTITVFMRKIREKLEENPSDPRYLLTVWRVGYKFASE